MVSRVQDTWFRGYGVFGFESTGYIVSGVHSFSLPRITLKLVYYCAFHSVFLSVCHC